MKKIFFMLGVFILSANSALFCQISLQLTPEQKLAQLKKEVTDNLANNILSYWSAKMPDEVNGGFYGRIDRNNQVIPDADKGGILNARILWTYSSSYRVTKNPEYLRLATRAKDYILSHFIDKEYGGVFMILNAKGEPQDTRKHTYTQAFFIYGLSEYARATGDKEALKAAKDIFELFEKNVLDKESNGYFEVFSRDWQRSRDRLIGEKSAADEKTMNTSLHVMEAYANLYRAWPDKRMAERLKNMIDIFLDHIIDKNRFHLICFLDKNWNSTSEIDSYGHDIESSWLLYEAALLLKDPALLKRVKEVSIKIADAASEGLLPDGSMLTEKDRVTGRTRTTRSWWEQAETVVGYTNAYELTGDEKYLNRAINAWNFINKYMVDKVNGSWFTSVSPEGVGGGDKAGNWICPYHSGRMCLEIMERVKEK
ncbi:MAG: AGE family epimerase/isomerase [Bacteroidales bacterium]|nr:AGE family epimerase/isomerase [Bacteroidales bacterium]